MLMSKIRFNNTQLTRSVGTAPLAELLNLPAAYSNATLTRTMVNPTPNTGDGFGVSVAVCESYSIVGASLDDSTGTDSGYAYIYDNATGNLLHSIANPNAYSTTFQDYFGTRYITRGYSIVSIVPLILKDKYKYD